MQEIICPTCGVTFYSTGAEDLAFNSRGAFATCSGTGIVRTVNEAVLVPDESLSIDDGAVVVWGTLMWFLMKDVCREMGVRTDIPFKDLTDEEKEIVYHGPAVKKHMHYFNHNSHQEGEMDFTYYSAVNTFKNALSKATGEKKMKRVEKYLIEGVCPDCQGSRYSAKEALVKRKSKSGQAHSLPDLINMSVDQALKACQGMPSVAWSKNCRFCMIWD